MSIKKWKKYLDSIEKENKRIRKTNINRLLINQSSQQEIDLLSEPFSFIAYMTLPSLESKKKATIEEFMTLQANGKL